MADKLPPIRRVVTGDAAGGRSRIVEDGPVTTAKTVPERPGFRSVNVWRTEDTPASIGAPGTVAKHEGLPPPKNGTILRIIDFPPESGDRAAVARGVQATFRDLHKHGLSDAGRSPHPGMHRTDTVDYAIVLEGEIVAVLDDAETLLHAGDVLIQRGTNHAWANRSARTARVAFVLIDAIRS